MSVFTRPLILRSPDPAPGGGAGGDPPKPFTDEQVAALGQIINSAVTSQLKRQKPATDEIAAAVKSALTKEALDPILKAWVEENDDGEPEPKGAPAKPDPQIAALQTKLSELTTARENDLKALEAEKAKARDDRAQSALKSALAPHVRPEGLDIAASHLFLAQKRVTYDDQGNPLFTIRRAPFAGATEEDVPLPLPDGVAHWLKSDDAKMFLPAPAGAAGGQPGQAPRRANAGVIPTYDKPAATHAERQQRIAERAQALAQKYPGRFDT